MGAALRALAILVAWIVWLPFVTSPAATVVCGTFALICAFHGWGRIVARLVRRDDVATAVVMQWGVAGVICVAGLMLALRVYNAPVLIVVGCAAHSIDLALRFRTAPALPRLRFWALPLALIAVIATVSTLGAAGQTATRPFDDECNVFAQAQRLSTTSALDDAIGFPRRSQLGAHQTLGTLSTAFADARTFSVVDSGAGLCLFLLLVCSLVKPRDGASAIWASLLIIACAAMQFVSDLMPLWIPAGLILGVYASVPSTPSSRALIPVGLLAGALCALRLELVVLVIALIALVMWNDRKTTVSTWSRVATLCVPIVVTIAVYVFARAHAWASVPAAKNLLGGVRLPSTKGLATCAAIAAATVPLVLLLLRELEDRALRLLCIAACVGCAAISGHVLGDSKQPLWSILIAAFSAVATCAAAHESLRRIAMVVSAFVCFVTVDAQSAPGAKGLGRQYGELLYDVQYARYLAPAGPRYDDLLAHVPPGDRVAAWVSRPELLDYTHYRMIDIRTRRVAQSRNLEKVLRATGARWLLVDGDGIATLAGILEKRRSVANRRDVQLVDLN